MPDDHRMSMDFPEDRPQARLRLEISEEPWLVSGLLEQLDALDWAYRYLAIPELPAQLIREAADAGSDGISSIAPMSRGLGLESIRYGSPGEILVVGLASALPALAGIISGLWTWLAARETARAKVEQVGIEAASAIVREQIREQGQSERLRMVLARDDLAERVENQIVDAVATQVSRLASEPERLTAPQIEER